MNNFCLFLFFQKQKHSKPPLLKHSETEANLSSLTSATTVDVRWLKSASVSSLPHYKKTSDYPKNELSVTNPSDGTTTLDSSKDQSWKKNWNCLKCQVYPDVSHGVILLTAAYFNKKKM